MVEKRFKNRINSVIVSKIHSSSSILLRSIVPNMYVYKIFLMNFKCKFIDNTASALYHLNMSILIKFIKNNWLLSKLLESSKILPLVHPSISTSPQYIDYMDHAKFSWSKSEIILKLFEHIWIHLNTIGIHWINLNTFEWI
jgi:hypothetical protein